MQNQTFSPGFRLSAVDVFVLVVGMAATIWLSMIVWWWGFVIAFVLGHFFLFCNIIRMARPLELCWSGVFVVVAAPTIALDMPGWLVTASVSLAVTMLLVAVEMRKPSYHGLGWQWINPGLPAWWEAQSTRTGASN